MGVHDRGPLSSRLSLFWRWVTHAHVQRPIEMTAAAVLAVWVFGGDAKG